MTDDEYREFLTFLFEHYVRPRLSRVRQSFRFDRMDRMEEGSHHLDPATQAAHVLRYIEAHCNDDDDVYDTFTLDRLKRTVFYTSYSLRFGNRVAEEAGFVAAFEDHVDEVLSGLEPHHLPAVDKDVLREMGSVNPEMEIRALVLRAKTLRECLRQSTRELPIGQQLKHAEERIAKAEQEFDAGQKKSRRWFKGLGQIAQGAAFSIANVALAVGVLKFPVSPETQTWGSVASVATGIGTILNGVGDLRNE